MSWVKLDDGFADHPRTMRAGRAAAWHLVTLLCWSARYLTDGHVPTVVANDPDPADAARLVDVGFLVACDAHPDCLTIRSYLRYQPSAEEALALREARAEAGRRGGIRSGQSRREANEANAKQTPSKPGSKHSSNGEAKTNPVPVPVVASVLLTPPVVEGVGNARAREDNGEGVDEGQEGQEPQSPEGWSVVLDAVKELGKRDRGAGRRAQRDVDEVSRFSVPARMVLARLLASRLEWGWLPAELVDELCEGRWSDVDHPLRVWQTVAGNLPLSRRPLSPLTDADR